MFGRKPYRDAAPAGKGSVVKASTISPFQSRTTLNAAASRVTRRTVAEDTEPDRGPAAGIETGLRASSAEYAFVVACDMPFVDPDLAAYLFERAEPHDGAVPRPDEWLQTTQAVYRAQAMADACEAALARGDRRVLDALSDLDYVVVGEAEIREHADMASFENLNTRAEFEAAARRNVYEWD